MTAPLPPDNLDLAACLKAAHCAGVSKNNQDRFAAIVCSAIREARRLDGLKRKQTRSRNVRPYFARLRKALEAMQSFSERPKAIRADHHGEAAGAYLAAVIAPVSIADWIAAADRAEYLATAHDGTRLSAGRASSVSGSFSIFVHMLCSAAIITGGNLKCHRGGKSEVAKGTFVQVLNALRPRLPSGFIPKSQHGLQDTFDAAKANMPKPNSGRN